MTADYREDDILKTLLLPLQSGQVVWPQNPALFINGRASDGLPAGTVVQQYFRPDAAGAVPDIPQGPFDLVLVRGSKNHLETRYFIGRALDVLPDSGFLICAAANDAGGKRLKKDMLSLGLPADSLSKHKCQVVWAQKDGHDAPAWIKEGEPQPILNGAFISQPGLFGWDKIDKGSALLAHYLPENTLRGSGADFGCGYGYLSAHILENHSVDKIYSLDADYRAVELCRRNLQSFNADKEFLWADLTKAPPGLPALDWVVMNPPFHQGKQAQYDIGAAFIRNAAAALKAGGTLWMVANAHLPYEDILKDHFSGGNKITEEQGFKVFHAEK